MAALHAFHEIWRVRDARHRSAWLVIVAITAVILLVLLAMPLADAIARTRDDVARNRVMLDIARHRAAENETLARETPLAHADPRSAIDRVLAAEGLRYQPAASQAGDATTNIVIADTDFDALVRALDRLAREDAIHVSEAIVTARVEPGRVRAELALRR